MQIKTLAEYSKQCENAVEQWFDFVASVFKKANRDHFVQHYLNDPLTDNECIFVALDNEEDMFKIVATVRIFHRDMYLDGNVVSVCGIGEVSTDEAYRGRGIASTLLQMAVEYMNKHQIPFSSLHTSSAAPLYEKHGWRRVAMKYGTLQMDQYDENLVGKCFKASESVFEDSNYLQDMQKLYHGVSSGLNGACARLLSREQRLRDEYWQRWVKREATQAPDCEMYLLLDSDNKHVIAYLIVKCQSTAEILKTESRSTKECTFMVREFASSADELQSFQHFVQLVSAVMKDHSLTKCSMTRIPLHLTTSWMQSNCSNLSVPEEGNNDFFMYREQQQQQHLFSAADIERHHFWHTDSF